MRTKLVEKCCKVKIVLKKCVVDTVVHVNSIVLNKSHRIRTIVEMICCVLVAIETHLIMLAALSIGWAVIDLHELIFHIES